jgi:hypothetical protein
VVAVLQVAGGLEEAQAAVVELPRALREAASTRLAIGRAFGTASLPGHFAVLLLMAVPLLLDRWHAARWGDRLLRGAGLAGVVVGIALTRSLAALAVGAVLALVAASLGLPRRPILLGAGVALLLVLVLTAAWRTDLGSIEPVRLRLVNWRTAVAAFAGSPFVGVGLGGVGQAGLLAPTAASNITPYTHNSYLQLLAELGLVGLPVVAAGVLWLVRVIGLGLRQAPALALAVLVVPVHNLVDFSAYQPEIVVPWAVLLGALAARVRPMPDRPVPATLLLPVLAVCSLASVASWRGETVFDAALLQKPEQRSEMALTAARWQPWALTPLLLAADGALERGAPPPELGNLDRAIASRWWVRPRSGAWAQTRALLLLGQEHRGEALVWAREARRRAPKTPGLDALEAACAPRL